MSYCETCGDRHLNHTIGRLGYALRATRLADPKSFGARLRMLWQDFVVHGLFGPGGEVCWDCGRTYRKTIWWADNALYVEVTGWDRGGLLCPACFSDRADAKGLLLRWTPEVVSHPGRASS